MVGPNEIRQAAAGQQTCACGFTPEGQKAPSFFYFYQQPSWALASLMVAATTSCSTTRHRHRHANSVRIASSLRADLIFGNDKDMFRGHVV